MRETRPHGSGRARIDQGRGPGWAFDPLLRRRCSSLAEVIETPQCRFHFMSRIALAHRFARRTMNGPMKKLLAEMLAERLASIEEAIAQLEGRGDAETGLHNLGAHLPNLLILIERDAGITAAADDLLSTATAF